MHTLNHCNDVASEVPRKDTYPKIFQNLLSPLMLRKSSFEFWGKVLPGVNLASVTKINMTQNYRQSCWLDPGPVSPALTLPRPLHTRWRLIQDSKGCPESPECGKITRCKHAWSLLLPSQSQTGAAMEQRAEPQANATCRSQLPKPLTL